MKNHEITVAGINELSDAAKQILEFAKGKKVLAFYGDMGTGKTTLIKEFCRQLGSDDNFSSPTFSIVNEYSIPASPEKIYHIDLFRLKNIEESVAAGVQEYIDSGNYCFIEWARLIEPLLPDDAVKISMACDGNVRNLSIFIK